MVHGFSALKLISTPSVAQRRGGCKLPGSWNSPDDRWSDQPGQWDGQFLPDPDHPLVARIVRSHVGDVPRPHMIVPDGLAGLRSPLLLELVGGAVGAGAAEVETLLAPLDGPQEQ